MRLPSGKGAWAALNTADSCGFQVSEEDQRMDAHFSEYLGAIWAMQETYGERPEGLPTEFHCEAEELAEAHANQQCLGV